MKYIQKNWKHISASIIAMCTVAGQIIGTKQFTPSDMAAIITAVGLMLTTNSGTNTPS